MITLDRDGHFFTDRRFDSNRPRSRGCKPFTLVYWGESLIIVP